MQGIPVYGPHIVRSYHDRSLGQLFEVALDIASWKIQRFLLGGIEQKLDTDDIFRNGAHGGSPNEVFAIVVDKGRDLWCIVRFSINA